MGCRVLLTPITAGEKKENNAMYQDGSHEYFNLAPIVPILQIVVKKRIHMSKVYTAIQGRKKKKKEKTTYHRMCVRGPLPTKLSPGSFTYQLSS